jgi:hypothetical protein
MNLTFSATVEKFDKEAYLKAVQAEMRRVFIKAGQKFLLAAVPRVPILTGMARGAFRNLEDLVGKVTSDAATGGVRIRTGRAGGSKNTGSNTTAKYYYYPPGGGRVLRTPQAGRDYATAGDQVLDLSGASLASGKTSFYFRFKVDISYLDINEAKWQAFKLGGDAMAEYIKENLELPDPLKYTTRKIVKGG